mmetsp:Transcript_13393/g.56647  ORF Transcript_13393/g.56647 Transcript_13393/m.56647 type:complete len:203 (-) Transcript_13393:388-996(-)
MAAERLRYRQAPGSRQIRQRLPGPREEEQVHRRPQGSFQAAAAAVARGAPAATRDRDPVPPQASKHPEALRIFLRSEPRVPDPRVRRPRRAVQGAPEGEEVQREALRHLHRVACQGAGVLPQEACDSPRHQAREPPHRHQGRAEDCRFRLERPRAQLQAADALRYPRLPAPRDGGRAGPRFRRRRVVAGCARVRVSVRRAPI